MISRSSRAIVVVLGLVAATVAGTGPAIADRGQKKSVESRFTAADEFCTPPQGTPKPKAIDEGITADSITVTNVALDVETLADIGFAFDTGDSEDITNTFVNYLNEECGGIDGRTLAANTIVQDPPSLSPDPLLDAQTACTEIAEDRHAVAAFSNTGIGSPLAPCLNAQGVIFIGVYDFSQAEFDDSNGLLFSTSHSPTDILRFAAREFAPELKGKRVGVVYDDTDPNPQIVQEGLLDALKEEGIKVKRVDVIACGGQVPCTGSLIPSVQGMIDDKINALFPLLDAITNPNYVAEMAAQGVQPGDIQFYGSSFVAADSEIVSGKIIEFGGEEAGALYDGARMVTGSREGEFRLDDYELSPFDQMCNDLYAANSDEIDAPYDPRDSVDNPKYGNVAGHCGMIRMLARAIEAAGPNPTRPRIAKELSRLGAVDTGRGGPATFKPGKPTSPDAIAVIEFHAECPEPTTHETGHCFVPVSDYKPIKSL